MATECLLLRGTKGLCEGEVFPLKYGQAVVIGRSRHCEVSLKNCKRYKDLAAAGKGEDTEFLTVSRRHLRIHFYNSQSIELEDLSTNGTFLNGEPVRHITITDIKVRAYELRMGARETLSLEWGTVETPHEQPSAAAS